MLGFTLPIRRSASLEEVGGGVYGAVGCLMHDDWMISLSCNSSCSDSEITESTILKYKTPPKRFQVFLSVFLNYSGDFDEGDHILISRK